LGCVGDAEAIARAVRIAHEVAAAGGDNSQTPDDLHISIMLEEREVSRVLVPVVIR
jgi:hypothetical protein